LPDLEKPLPVIYFLDISSVCHSGGDTRIGIRRVEVFLSLSENVLQLDELFRELLLLFLELIALQLDLLELLVEHLYDSCAKGAHSWA
jgi:hypothetical protein